MPSAPYSARQRGSSKTEESRIDALTATGAVTNYDYDPLGDLRSVDLPDGTRIEYVVDGLHRRVGRRVFDAQGTLTAEQHWLYRDALNPIAELDGQGNVTKRFVYGSRPHVPDYMVTYDQSGAETGTYRLVCDHLGSVRLVVDTSDGSVVERMRYDAFGNVLEDTNEGFEPFGFAGGLYDASTGLVRFGARDYDPRVGRWTAKDPLGFGGGDSNVYVYVGSDPVNSVDPSGLWSLNPWKWSNNTLDTIANASGGFGDALLFGLGDNIRGLLGLDDIVNECSPEYLRGGVAGALTSLAVTAGYGAYRAYQIPSVLYHFTSFEAAAAILEDGVINVGVRNAYGEGVYLTRFANPLIASLQGAASTEAIIEVETEGLQVVRTMVPGTFRVVGSVFLP